MNQTWVVQRRFDMSDEWQPIMVFRSEAEADQFIDRLFKQEQAENGVDEDNFYDYYRCDTCPLWMGGEDTR